MRLNQSACWFSVQGIHSGSDGAHAQLYSQYHLYQSIRAKGLCHSLGPMVKTLAFAAKKPILAFNVLTCPMCSPPSISQHLASSIWSKGCGESSGFIFGLQTFWLLQEQSRGGPTQNKRYHVNCITRILSLLKIMSKLLVWDSKALWRHIKSFLTIFFSLVNAGHSFCVENS